MVAIELVTIELVVIELVTIELAAIKLVDFASVLAMDHAGMVCMFKSLQDIGLRGFLEGTTYVFDNVVTEFFINAKVIVGTVASTVCNRKLVITKEIFSATFQLPLEGMPSLADIPKETITEMRHTFSATDVDFKVSSKKKEMLFAYRLLHDIVAKSIFNWGRILFQRLLSMVQNRKRQSQGFIVPISMLMGNLVKTDIGASVKLHSQNILMGKFVQSYIKKNQDIISKGETSKRTGDAASNTGESMPRQEEPTVTKSVAGAQVHKPSNIKSAGEGQQKKKKTRKVAAVATQNIEQPPVEPERPVAPTNFDSEEVSEPDSCPLVGHRCRQEQVIKSSDSESTISMPLTNFVKRRRTQRQHQQMGWTGVTIASQPDPIQDSPTENFRIGQHDDRLKRTRDNGELRVIATVHRDHRAMAGLPFLNREISYLESASPQEQPLTLKFSSLADQEQVSAGNERPQLDLPNDEHTEMTTHKHQAQENEPPKEFPLEDLSDTTSCNNPIRQPAVARTPSNLIIRHRPQSVL
ncbi:mucin-2-like [Dorcoceras hygrometricum]|uniref:Mucin-2-like n=1 Tax=Dorcoceras hygrometricum TaxID=472368 RepID=A0A2Z7BGX5_9LAMI|nr:mucin-2-like [Dorcoceras hygrometricum]